MMEGELTVESVVGEGSTFTLTLPRIAELAVRLTAMYDDLGRRTVVALESTFCLQMAYRDRGWRS